MYVVLRWKVDVVLAGCVGSELEVEAGGVAFVHVTPRPGAWRALGECHPASHAAFVVGVASYPPPLHLSGCRFDAEDMAWLLHRKGYAVTRLVDPGFGKLMAAFELFVGSLAPKATVVLFFSGHGVQVSGVNYLLPLDALQLELGMLAAMFFFPFQGWIKMVLLKPLAGAPSPCLQTGDCLHFHQGTKCFAASSTAVSRSASRASAVVPRTM
jgi:hypothetical protein